MKRFLTIFPPAENVHLIKDVGMLPYMMHKEYNYKAVLASYKNGSYGYLDTEVKGLEMTFIKRIFNRPFWDVLIFLLLNSRKYDILQVYHLTDRSLIWCRIFKFLSFRKKKTYLKLDADDGILDFKPSDWKGKIRRYFLKDIDLVSVETKYYEKTLNETNLLGRQVRYCPNGFYDDGIRDDTDFDGKENIMLTVGRIGTTQKATEILCEGFRLFAGLNKSWKLEIAGPIAFDFQNFIDEYFNENPELKSRVRFLGQISDRDVLQAQYKKAKIFVLSSRWEGFPLVFTEALKAGCFIITTDIPAGRDVINEGKYGLLFPVDDPEALGKAFIKAVQNKEKLKTICPEIQDFGYEQFYWPKICNKINGYLS